MGKFCTTLEQSKRLMELGLDVNTANLCWRNDYQEGWYMDIHPYSSVIVPKYSYNKKEDVLLPAWSLSSLLDLMPNTISIKAGEHSAYFYHLDWQFANDNSLRYVGHDGKCLIDVYSDHDDDNYKDSIDTAFEMVCWLIEGKKIKKLCVG